MCLNRLIDLLPSVIPGLAAIVTEADEYSASVAIPPYFADTLPGMPVVSYYEIGMEPGAAPMQFVRFYVDYYIPEIFTGVFFEDQSDLVELYTAVAAFFDLTTTPAPSHSPTTIAPTGTPVSTRPPAPSSTTEAPTSSYLCFATSQELLLAVDAYLSNPLDEMVLDTYGPIESWCVSEVTDFDNLFDADRNPLAATFNEDIGGWNVSNSESMFAMFEGAREFNQDLSGWVSFCFFC